MTKLYLLRHGQTISNLEKKYQGQGDSHLTDLGRKQSELLAEALKDESFSAIYSSDLNRSYETAVMMAGNHNLEVTKVPELRERDYGVWENLSFQEIEGQYPDLYKLWRSNPARALIPQAETLEEVQKRGVKGIQSIILKHPEQTVGVVAHGGINRTILMHYLGMDLNNFWNIKQSNCAVNIIDFGSRPVIMLVNGTWFLPACSEKERDTRGYY